MNLELTDDQRAVILDALKRRLIGVRYDYDTAVEIGDPLADRLRARRDAINALIETFEDPNIRIVPVPRETRM